MIDLWFSCGSTYSGITILRLAEIEARSGVTFFLKPFYLGAILDELGPWPYREGSPKTDYMWRDLQRRADDLQIPANFPVGYPSPTAVLANQIAHVGLHHGWGRAYLEAAYRHWFATGEAPGSENNNAFSFAAVGQKEADVIELIASTCAHEALVAQLNEVRRLGIFGAPTFSTKDELFWGDDRLEDAIAWAKRGK